MTNNQPIQPQEDLISDFVNEIKEKDLEHRRRSVAKARNALIFTAVVVFAVEVAGMFSLDYFSVPLFIIAVVKAGIFVGLALWTKKKPYCAVVGGIIAYLGLLVYSIAIVAYMSGIEDAFKGIFSGVIVKVLILVTLFKALSDAKSIQNYKKI